MYKCRYIDALYFQATALWCSRATMRCCSSTTPRPIATWTSCRFLFFIFVGLGFRILGFSCPGSFNQGYNCWWGVIPFSEFFFGSTSWYNDRFYIIWENSAVLCARCLREQFSPFELQSTEALAFLCKCECKQAGQGAGPQAVKSGP